jgi:hypothetical protein
MATPNALFAIINVDAPAVIAAKLESLHAWLHLQVAEGQWLVIAPAATTSKEVSDALGITNAEPVLSNGIVLRVESYFGRTAGSTWEWIRNKQGAEIGTPV